MMAWQTLPNKSCNASPAQSRRLRCRSIFRQRHFSGASGLTCNRLPSEKHAHIPKLQKPSGILRQFVRLRGHARPTPWLLQSRATAYCGLMATLADIAGGWSERRPYWRWRVDNLIRILRISLLKIFTLRLPEFDNSLPTLILSRD